MTEEEIVEEVALAIFKQGASHATGPELYADELYAEQVGYWRRLSRAAIAAHKAALKEAGMVIVPKEPTRKMIDAACNLLRQADHGGQDVADVGGPEALWREMVSVYIATSRDD